jgi:cobalt/nickel transport system permease protein
MDLFSIDKYSHLTSPIHKLNPVVSLTSFLAFVVVVVLVPSGSFAPLFVALLSLSCVAFVSRIPLQFLIRRSLVVVPFAIAIGALNVLGKVAQLAIHHSALASLAFGPAGLPSFLNMVMKSFVCILGTTLLVSTAGSVRLFSAMQNIGVPTGLTTGTCFLYRYMSVVADELSRMKRARDSRRAGNPSWLEDLRSLGALVGVLFIRSYERAERVYVAMCSRGFDGFGVTLVESRTSRRDILFPVLLLGPLVLSIFIEKAI